MGFATAGPPHQHGVALLGEECAAGEVSHECFVDRRALELEVVEVLSERQLGDAEFLNIFSKYKRLSAHLASRQAPTMV
jgi:hypothetical protein